jgi:hypothetical protein
MKLFRQICFLLLVSSFVFGQSAPNNTNADDSRISNQIKTLQDAIASQQQQIEQLRQELAARKQAESAPHLALPRERPYRTSFDYAPAIEMSSGRNS